jgi:hypothetical protein
MNNKIKPPFRPKILMIETYSYCNAKCLFCVPKSKYFIAPTLWAKFLAQSQELGVESIVPYVKAEPFANPNLDKYLSEIRNQGLGSIMYTNSSFRIPRTVLEMRKLNGRPFWSYWVFSICGLNPNTVRVLQGLDLLTQERNCKEFLAAWHDLGRPFPVEIHLIDHPLNRLEQKMFLNKWGSLGKIIPAFHSCGFLYPQVTANFLKIERPLDLDSSKPCLRLTEEMAFLGDGTALLCCVDYDRHNCLGQFPAQSLASLWAAQVEKFKLHLKTDFAPCNKCVARTINWPQLLKF